jgi:metallo-beta-lactamase class B
MFQRMIAGLGVSVVAAALVTAQAAQTPGGGQGAGRGRGAGAAGGGQAQPGGRGGGEPTAEQWNSNAKTQEWQAKAKAVAGNDADLQFDVSIFCAPGRGASNEARATLGVPASEPKLPPFPAPSPARVIGLQRMFDNFYWVGNSGIGAWIITSDDGYIVYDSMNSAADARDIIVPGMKQAGLDPTKIKYLVFGHYHGDHTGGGRYLQQLSGAKAIMHWADWDLYEQAMRDAKAGQMTGSFGRLDDLTPMTRDIEGTDGMEITVGNRQKVTATVYQMTGHTPGSQAMIVPVRYAGREHPILIITAGNAFNNINAMIGGYEHIWDIGIKRKVESVMQAHPNTNMNTLARTKYVHENYGKIKTNPLLYGAERTEKYLNIVKACTRGWMVATGMTQQ